MRTPVDCTVSLRTPTWPTPGALAELWRGLSNDVRPTLHAAKDSASSATKTSVFKFVSTSKVCSKNPLRDKERSVCTVTEKRIFSSLPNLLPLTGAAGNLVCCAQREKVRCVQQKPGPPLFETPAHSPRSPSTAVLQKIKIKESISRWMKAWKKTA